MPGKNLISIVKLALQEDINTGDITTRATIIAGEKGTARIVSKGRGVVAGTAAAIQVFRQLDKKVKVTLKKRDGSRVKKGDCILKVTGKRAAILTGERTALNFLQRLSGVATITSQYVRRLQGLKTKMLDTRKTTPGMRQLEKAAVLAGGGTNHRAGLYDMILVKDNHIDAAGGIGPALDRVYRYKKVRKDKCPVEIEARTLQEVKEALPYRVDMIMLDNMSLKTMRSAVKLVREHSGRTQVEASGTMSLNRIRAVARTGVDFISAGTLTHSVPALDISLTWD